MFNDTITCKTPILKPIIWDIPPDAMETDKLKYKVWVIMDACPVGVSAVLAQGETWLTSQPAAFMSKKFTPTQRAYFGYELEVLSVLEALYKWLNELTGNHKFTVVTDHKALIYFKQKIHNMGCHMRWQNFFHAFNCEIIYIEGHKNKVANALSRYYKSSHNDDLHYNEYISANICLDKQGDDLPMGHAEEAHKLLLGQVNLKTQLATLAAADEIEQRQVEAIGLNPPIKSIGRSDQLIAELIQIPDKLIQDTSLLQTIQKGLGENLTW